MSVCKYCNLINYNPQQLRVWYYDPLCHIYETGKGTIKLVYSYHSFPTPSNHKWMMTQLRIVGGKLWDKDWTFKHIDHDHWGIEAKALPNKIVKKNSRAYNHFNKTKELE